MNKIVDLHAFREKALEQKSFGPWQKRFGESYGTHTRLSDLSDKTLFNLAQPEENSSTAFYEIIMGALDLGPAAKFYYLSNDEQMRVVLAAENGIPALAFSSALAYYDAYRSARLPAYLTQAQRDYFGAHTYQRVDQPRGKYFHTNWTGQGGDITSNVY